MKNLSLSNQILDNSGNDFVKRRKPAWLRAKLPGGEGYSDTRKMVDRYQLHTVCESAKCPNLGECWARGTATMMILGDVCTRSCGFCHIKTGAPPEYDLDEPRRVGEAAALMSLKHIVITSVNRDELPDGGAEIWAETIREIRRQSPGTQVEVLIPDFVGDWDALQIVLDERPEILNHNLETVPRLYPAVRPQAKYSRSIELLKRAKAQGLTVKTGIMVGIGEQDEEVHELMQHLVDAVRVHGVASDIPETNVTDHLTPPDPNRMLSDNELNAQPTDGRTSEIEPATRPGGRASARTGSLHENIGQDKPTGMQELREDGRMGRYMLVKHTNPHWQHRAPIAPGDQTQRIAEISYPNATYPGVHETCDILTIGQYLQPTRQHLPISRWITPEQFAEFKRAGEQYGLRHVESGPLVRSSYHADNQVLQMEKATN